MEIGASDCAGSCLFDMVVRMSLDSAGGNRSSIVLRNSVIVVDDGSGRTKVGGRPRPAKLVTRTFRLRGDMVLRFGRSIDSKQLLGSDAMAFSQVEELSWRPLRA